MESKHLYPFHTQNIILDSFPSFYCPSMIWSKGEYTPGLGSPSGELASETLSAGTAGTDCRARTQKQHKRNKSHSQKKQFLSSLLLHNPERDSHFTNLLRFPFPHVVNPEWLPLSKQIYKLSHPH